ncbi:uncharacterized protein [Henckelia pumila]|uniref:uncharacterized protein n=1 Tax=Henckelia pumila TaxID=405737 RepID=UPI003C6DF313
MTSTRAEAKFEAMEKSVSGLQENMLQVQGRLEKIDRTLEGFGDLRVLIEQMIKAQGGEHINTIRVEDMQEKGESATGVGGNSKDDMVEEMKAALKKIELPMFEGEDPMGWLGKMEQYFEVHDTPRECKLKLAYICMQGPTVHWYRWMKAKIPTMTWDRLAEELLKRYGGIEANPYELIASLQQGELPIGTYIEKFERLVAQVGYIHEDQCLGYFMSGLREEIRRRMIVHNPRTVDRAMMLARGLEMELYGAVLDRGKHGSGFGVGPERRSFQDWVGLLRPNPMTENAVSSIVHFLGVLKPRVQET